MQNKYYTKLPASGAEFYQLKTTAEEPRGQVLSYSDEPEKMSKLLNEIEVFADYVGLRRFEDEEKSQPTHTYKIIIKRDGREISFQFHCSIADTYPMGKRQGIYLHLKTLPHSQCLKSLLYSVLACARSEYYCPLTFKDFADEFGYNSDSIKTKALWERCLEQSDKLQRIFSETEANYLPA